MANDARPVDANELLKQAIYCKEEDGSGVYAVPISCIFAAPTLKVEPKEVAKDGLGKEDHPAGRCWRAGS